MPVVRRGNDDGVDVRPIQHFPEIGVLSATLISGGGVDLAFGLRATFGIDIAHGHDPVAAGDDLLAAAPGPDEGGGNPAAGRWLARTTDHSRRR